eukprot:symbB.v1.2.004192.t1/scaffold236.1/size256932/2
MEDVSVVFDGTNGESREIQAYSLLLMLASPVFQRMLTQDMSEKSTKQIKLPGKDPDEFQALMAFFHPVTGRQEAISVENVDFLIRWCDEYCIDSLKIECYEFIKKQPPSMQRLIQAHSLGIHDYADTCIDHLLELGRKDWVECYEYPKLTQRVLERSLVILPTLSKTYKGTNRKWSGPDWIG